MVHFALFSLTEKKKKERNNFCFCVLDFLPYFSSFPGERVSLVSVKFIYLCNIRMESKMKDTMLLAGEKIENQLANTNDKSHY